MPATAFSLIRKSLVDKVEPISDADQAVPIPNPLDQLRPPKSPMKDAEDFVAIPTYILPDYGWTIRTMSDNFTSVNVSGRLDPNGMYYIRVGRSEFGIYVGSMSPPAHVCNQGECQ